MSKYNDVHKTLLDAPDVSVLAKCSLNQCQIIGGWFVFLVSLSNTLYSFLALFAPPTIGFFNLVSQIKFDTNVIQTRNWKFPVNLFYSFKPFILLKSNLNKNDSNVKVKHCIVTLF